MEFDYIICGGGSAGCVLAARLSQDPNLSVCLIEAGGMGRDIFVRAPALVAAMVSGRPPLHNWAFHTVPQPGLNGRRGFQPRGKGLGGSSAINAMLYVRGHPSDYDGWAELGAEGWDYLRADTLPVDERSGLTGTKTSFQNMLVFRRILEEDAAMPVSAGSADQPVFVATRRVGPAETEVANAAPPVGPASQGVAAE